MQPPIPTSSISIGRMPRLLPPFSTAASITTAWPLSASPTKVMSSTHFTRAFIGSLP